MGFQDGFGEDRRDIEYEEFILDNERLLKLKAAERLRTSDVSREIWDDVLQEGRIVQWKVLRKDPKVRDIKKFVSASMSFRIKEVISRETWTGMETHRGRPIDPLRRRDRDSTDDETSDVSRVVESSDWVERVMWAAHHGEIMRVLNEELTFTQRAYVYRRFWEGWTNPEIAAERGLTAKEIERQWRVNIRPRLVERLGHLAEV